VHGVHERFGRALAPASYQSVLIPPTPGARGAPSFTLYMREGRNARTARRRAERSENPSARNKGKICKMIRAANSIARASTLEED